MSSHLYNVSDQPAESFETVNTHELQIGDHVYCHGTLFKLTERGEREECASLKARRGNVVWFHTEVVRIDYPEGMPVHWRHDWIIQGNKLAAWARRVSP
jgi:hypothetical protein